jgi:hypothetical protein
MIEWRDRLPRVHKSVLRKDMQLMLQRRFTLVMSTEPYVKLLSLPLSLPY